jgi:hypothetical protein
MFFGSREMRREQCGHVDVTITSAVYCCISIRRCHAWDFEMGSSKLEGLF